MFEHLSKIAAVDPTSAGWAPDELLGLVFRRTVQTSAEIFTPGNFHRRVPDYLGCSSSCAAMVRHFSAISISCCLIKGSTVCAARLSHSSLAQVLIGFIQYQGVRQFFEYCFRDDPARQSRILLVWEAAYLPIRATQSRRPPASHRHAMSAMLDTRRTVMCP